ncbi:MAG TPA: hypothetical protein VEI97_06990 [bacterium]|nr:hypothetical protein [bacterium]
MRPADKTNLRARLEAEGRWKDFVARREALKKTGLEPGKCWDVAALEFPPTPARPQPTMPVAASPGEGVAPLPPADHAGVAVATPTRRPNIRADIEWVYQHLADSVAPADAPSPGARALWDWAHQTGNRASFFGDFVTKLLPTRAQLDKDGERFSPDGDKAVLDLIQKVLDGCKHVLPGAEGVPGEPGVPAVAG